jgi:exoribonuclease R
MLRSHASTLPSELFRLAKTFGNLRVNVPADSTLLFQAKHLNRIQRRLKTMLKKALIVVLFALQFVAVANVVTPDPWPSCLPCDSAR